MCWQLLPFSAHACSCMSFVIIPTCACARYPKVLCHRLGLHSVEPWLPTAIMPVPLVQGSRVNTAGMNSNA
ncbi:hypothetical protein B0T22DRAFT_457162 [Podospora appendiculata]|uniref:Secreted protein n=1 Tax=Podospora appendiculata TaxID=314037 RepID=A0AAE0X7S0_9PEZI|nr:hypothetical protein B0T22DRAFT_457162 [Podospora appendiculata]